MDERLRNLMIYKMYATDEEIQQIAPFILITVLLVFGVLWLLDAKKTNEKNPDKPNVVNVERPEE